MVSARLGRPFRPWLALALELSESGVRPIYSSHDDHSGVDQYGIGLLLHVCPAPHLWLRSGIGVSRLVVYDPDGMSIQDTGLALSVAIGVPFSRRVDLSLRFERAHFDAQGSFIPFNTWLVLGVNWY